MAPKLQRDSACVGQVRHDHQQEGMTRIIVRRLLAIPGVRRVLDVGCGDGYAMELFQAAGKECLGVTLNAAGVDTCLRRGLSAVRGDAHDPDSIFCREFDLVYCRQSVEHFYSPFLALVAMNRVLRYDKFLFVSLPDESWIEADDHLYVLNFRQMTTLLHKTGFRPVLLWEDRYIALVDRCFLARKVSEPWELQWPHRPETDAPSCTSVIKSGREKSMRVLSPFAWFTSSLLNPAREKRK